MMNGLIDQILALLGSESGRLAYHLVLAFSIAGAIQVVVTQINRSEYAYSRRVLFGLGLLLLIQIALFVSSALARAGIIEGRLWLALFDRAAALVSLVVLGWLWCFPRPDPGADAAALVVGFLALVGSIFASLWWIQVSYASGDPSALNGSQIDIGLQVASLVLIGASALLLVLNRPSGWGYGLAMLLLLAAGRFVYLLLPYSGDYPLVLRLFEIAAFPLLLLLPQRLQIDPGHQPTEPMIEDEWKSEPVFGLAASEFFDVSVGALYQESPEFLNSLLGLMDDLTEEQASRRVAAALAVSSKASIAVLVDPLQSDGQLRLVCGYDRITDRYYDEAVLDASSLPIMASCLRMGRLRRLAGSNTSPDRLTLINTFGIERPGAMLFVPVLSAEGKAESGVILIASDFHEDWTVAEQSAIAQLSRFLTQFLQRARETAAIRDELEQARQASRRIQDQAQGALEEDLKLRDQIAALQESARRDQDQIIKMSALMVGQLDLNDAVARSYNQTQRLQGALSQLEGEVIRQKRTGPGRASSAPGGDCRLAQFGLRNRKPPG